MRVKNKVHKRECLECLFTEINILTECRHPNVVKILDANFDGTLVKEQPILIERAAKTAAKEENIKSEGAKK